MDELRWQDELYDFLKQQGVTLFTYVPDAGHRILIDRSLADPDVNSIALTTEEEGVGLPQARTLEARGCATHAKQRRGQLRELFLARERWQLSNFSIISMRGDFGEEILGKCRWEKQ